MNPLELIPAWARSQRISEISVALNRQALKVLHFPRPITLTGPDSSLALCQKMISAGARRVLIVTDKPLFEMGLLKGIIGQLKSGGATVTVFSEVEPDPGYEVVLSGIARLKGCNAQAVLAVGGGSSIDCAKAIVHCHANNAHPADLAGLWLYALPRQKGLPLYAAPTTAGTGSEVTAVSVVSDKVAKVKKTIIDPKLIPIMVALDPKLMQGLPPAITAATGMDALTHAVEAYISSLADADTDSLARSAAADIVQHLPTAYRDGKNLDSREHMALASCMAGLAFTRAGVGYVHAIAHQLGALYHLPHGLANAIVLPHVLDFSKSHCASRLADLARACGLAEQGHRSDSQMADRFIELVRRLNADMGIPLFAAPLKRADFDTIIDNAFAEAHGTYGVPRYMSRSQMQALLTQLLPPIAAATPAKTTPTGSAKARSKPSSTSSSKPSAQPRSNSTSESTSIKAIKPRAIKPRAAKKSSSALA